MAALLARHSIAHWHLQQDTFWQRDMFAGDVDTHLNITSTDDVDLVFDQIDTHALAPRAGWINGANFYIRRPSAQTAAFFDTIAATMTQRYVLDNGLMGAMCRVLWADTVHCAFAPHTLINNWEWLVQGESKPTPQPPALLHLDCEADLTTSKQAMLASYGFWFVRESATSRECQMEQVAIAERIVANGVSLAGRQTASQMHWKACYTLMDWVLRVPVVGDVVRVWMPVFALYLMPTM